MGRERGVLKLIKHGGWWETVLMLLRRCTVDVDHGAFCLSLMDRPRTKDMRRTYGLGGKTGNEVTRRKRMGKIRSSPPLS